VSVWRARLPSVSSSRCALGYQVGCYNLGSVSLSAVEWTLSVGLSVRRLNEAMTLSCDHNFFLRSQVVCKQYNKAIIRLLYNKAEVVSTRTRTARRWGLSLREFPKEKYCKSIVRASTAIIGGERGCMEDQ